MVTEPVFPQGELAAEKLPFTLDELRETVVFEGAAVRLL
jgi:hypothetical protein